ncbi:YgcG family protein [Paracoccus sp. p4-l81]|uniref:TPM domain-containing protein n=1 Tax=Paracoccus sp. p4-l81 TaxID=3342806 RepID=UPI0035B7CA13
MRGRIAGALITLIAGLWAIAGLAQEVGRALTGPGVLDQARLLSDAQLLSLGERITALDRETGIQVAVVTQPVRDVKTSPEGYATALFNDWGIGQARSNDGILLLVLPAERFARIELGAGYNDEANLTAQDIISRTLLPQIGADPGRAITDTVNAMIDRIALPRAGQPGAAVPGGRSRGFDWSALIPAGFFGVIASLFGWNVWRRHQGARSRACPNCGATKLEAVTLNEADATGQIATRHMARCGQCGWFGPDPAPPAPPSRGPWGMDRPTRSGFGGGRGGGGSFGGGSSRGGGASGRW